MQTIAERWGPPAELSSPAAFTAGGFYEDQMGDGLIKQFVAIQELSDPEGLADWKTETNQWEAEAARHFPKDHPRPLNLDPGYLSQAKLVLATIKDRDHRLYLRKGIFAEVTLNFMGGRWIHHRWTYPDYRAGEVLEFATQCRRRLRQHLIDSGGFRTA